MLRGGEFQRVLIALEVLLDPLGIETLKCKSRPQWGQGALEVLLDPLGIETHYLNKQSVFLLLLYLSLEVLLDPLGIETN